MLLSLQQSRFEGNETTSVSVLSGLPPTFSATVNAGKPSLDMPCLDMPKGLLWAILRSWLHGLNGKHKKLAQKMFKKMVSFQMQLLRINPLARRSAPCCSLPRATAFKSAASWCGLPALENHLFSKKRSTGLNWSVTIWKYWTETAAMQTQENVDMSRIFLFFSGAFPVPFLRNFGVVPGLFRAVYPHYFCQLLQLHHVLTCFPTVPQCLVMLAWKYNSYRTYNWITVLESESKSKP